ncbi:hypothetical protein Bca101_069126 [Brassica carinata]
MLSCGACVCVSDRTNDAVFVAFDMEMDKLTNLQTEVAHILFPAQAKRVQFYFHTPNFTISCIITELQRAPLLAFVVDVGNNGSGPSGGDKPGGNPLASKVSADDNNAVVEAACVCFFIKRNVVVDVLIIKFKNIKVLKSAIVYTPDWPTQSRLDKRMKLYPEYFLWSKA